MTVPPAATAPATPALRTARLLLAPLTPADADDVFAYAQDPRVLRYVNARTPERVEDTRAWVEAACREPTARHWAVRLATDAGAAGPVVGVVEFDAVAPGLGAVHYALAASCWGRGLATEAVGAVLDWAVAHVPGLAAVETTVAQANAASARVLEKCGFSHQGSGLMAFPARGGVFPVDLFRLDRSTWRSLKTWGHTGYVPHGPRCDGSDLATAG